MATGEKEGEGAASETEVDSQGKRRRGAWWSGFFKKSNRSAGFLVKLVDQEEGIRFWLEGEAGAAGVTGGGGDGSAGGRRSALARALARQHVRLRDPKAISVVAARDIGETAAMETEVATPTMALMVPGSASPLLGCYGATTPPPILGALISASHCLSLIPRERWWQWQEARGDTRWMPGAVRCGPHRGRRQLHTKRRKRPPRRKKGVLGIVAFQEHDASGHFFSPSLHQHHSMIPLTGVRSDIIYLCTSVLEWKPLDLSSI